MPNNKGSYFMKELDSIFYDKMLSICKTVFLKARELVPYSTNKTKKENPHRELVLNAMRSTDPELKSYRALISSLNLYIGRNRPPENFLFKKLKGRFDGKKNPSMAYLIEKINSAKTYNKTHHKDRSPNSPQHKLENEVKKAIQFGIGNCGELANLTYALLLEIKNKLIRKFKIPIELMYCKDGDHAFVVVNRKPNSNVEDLSTWGSKAILVDTWDEDIKYAQSGKSVFEFKSSMNGYAYIKAHLPCVETSSYLGKGLSKRFIKHAKEKDRPKRFALWTPKYSGDKKLDKKKQIRIIPMELQDVPIKKRKREEHKEKEVLKKRTRLLG